MMKRVIIAHFDIVAIEFKRLKRKTTDLTCESLLMANLLIFSATAQSHKSLSMVPPGGEFIELNTLVLKLICNL